MKAKLTILVSIFLCFAIAGDAATNGSILSEFAGKFVIMRKLAKFCRNQNENTSIKALNSLREVFFRGSDLADLHGNRDYQQSIPGLTEKMNADVDRIYTGISNLENSLKVSDPTDNNDKYMNELLRYLIVSEIGIIVADKSFFTIRDKVNNDVTESLKFMRSAKYTLSAQNPENDTLILDKLTNLLDLAGYIYGEQIKWLMSTSYALQNLDIKSFTIQGDSVFSGFAVSRPPRIYIPSTLTDRFAATVD